jgi:PAS domain S-box-containing protein
MNPARVRKAILIPVIVFTVVSAVFVAIWLYARHHEFQMLQAKTTLTSEQVAIRLEEYIAEHLKQVERMQRFWRRGLINTPDSFESHALEVLTDFKGLQAINWIDPEGVIRWVVPEGPNLSAKNKDLKKHSGAAVTFLTTAKTGIKQVTPPIDLLQQGRGFAAYFPIVNQGENQGFLNAVFRIAPLIEDCLSRGVRNNYFFAVDDLDSEVYAFGNLAEIYRSRARASNEFQVGNRAWRVTLAPSPALIRSESGRVNDLMLALGVVLALGLAWVARRLLISREIAHQSEERYHAIFETSGTAMVTYGEDSIIELCNTEFLNISGKTRSQVEGKASWKEFITPESRSKMRQYHEQRSKAPTSVPRAYDADVVDKDGKIRSGIVTISIVPGTTMRVASFLDLSETKQAQQEMYRAEKMAALGQIIAGVAHEINNPNNFISFNLPILKRYIEAAQPILDTHFNGGSEREILNMSYEKWAEDLFKLIDHMQYGSSRITGIVSELKGYIRSQESEGRKPGEVRAVIDSGMTLVGKQIKKMVKRFDVEVTDGLPKVMMDAGKIEQVVINLIINAGQAADKEDSWVRLTAEHLAREGVIEIVVADNGIGMNEEVKEHVFDPFFTTKGRESGTGLGLAISLRTIEEHGGTISVISQEGESSTFTIRLPVYREEQA